MQLGLSFESQIRLVRMSLLHYQKLYINLFRENAKSIDQVVYCGNRNKEITGNNVDSTVSNIEYFNPYIVYPFDKINYFGKALRQFNFIKKIDFI